MFACLFQFLVAFVSPGSLVMVNWLTFGFSDWCGPRQYQFHSLDHWSFDCSNIWSVLWQILPSFTIQAIFFFQECFLQTASLAELQRLLNPKCIVIPYVPLHWSVNLNILTTPTKAKFCKNFRFIHWHLIFLFLKTHDYDQWPMTHTYPLHIQNGYV